MNIHEIADELDRLLEQTVVNFGMAARGFLVNSQKLRLNLIKLEKLGRKYRKASVEFEELVKRSQPKKANPQSKIDKKKLRYMKEIKE